MTKLNLVESSKVVGGGLCDRYLKQDRKAKRGSAWARRRVDSMARRRNVSHCLAT
jgi:hypothetical protein